MRSRFVKGCLLFVVLVIAAVGFAYWRFKTPPKVAENFRTLSPQEKQRRRAEARKTEDDVQQVIRNIKRGDKSPFRLATSEEVLNTLLQDRVNTDKFPIRNLRVGLDNGQLALQGTVPYQGMETTTTLTGSVSAENGKIVYKVDSLLLGGLIEAPKKWKQKAEKQVQTNLNRLLENQDINVTRAAIENKQLILEGTPR